MPQRTRLSYYFQQSSKPWPDVIHGTKQVNLNNSPTRKFHTGPNALGGGYIQASKRASVDMPDIKGIFSWAYIQYPFTNKPIVYDWVLDVHDPRRDYDTVVNGYLNRSDLIHAQHNIVPETQGIGISMATEGNDIVIPQGRAQREHSYANGWTFSIDNGTTFVNVHNGLDAVIGGQGRDHFVSQSMSFQEAYQLYQQKFVGTKPVVVTGSKFFVGGSYNDLLAGGADGDLLVGDRFNNYELYLNKAALSENVPKRFNGLKQRLLSYQPPDWNKRASSDDGTTSYDLGWGDAFDDDRGKKTYNRLWVPGNDVIHGYAGDDILYGDNNVEDNYYIYKMLKDPAVNWMGRSRIGDDFLDGGSGNDIIFGGIGSDAIIGGTGSDIISCGDLIIAPGYNPLFGPKVVWGNEYPATLVDPKVAWGDEYKKLKLPLEPDIFIVGNLYDEEYQIDDSRNGVEEVAKKIEDMEAAKGEVGLLGKIWNGVKFVASELSDTVSIIRDVVGAIVDLTENSADTAKTVDKAALPIDATTLIKDFDKSDILVFKVPSGADLKFLRGEGGNGNLQSDSRAVKNNPLTDVNNFYKGTGISYSATAGKFFNRIILDGYKDKLVVLRSVESPQFDGSYQIIGGSAYADVDKGWIVV